MWLLLAAGCGGPAVAPQAAYLPLEAPTPWADDDAPAAPRCAPGMLDTQAGGCVRARQLAVGGVSGCVLADDGRVLCWGGNVSGELGDGTGVSSPRPVLVREIDQAVHVAVGGRHACASLRTGAVACWGANEVGAVDLRREITEPRRSVAYCGVGMKPDYVPHNWRSRPSTVEGVAGAVSVTVGDDHSCALDADGRVLCWGSNYLGELGDDDRRAFRLRAVTGLPPMRELQAGSHHTCGRDDAGAVWCWGRNEQGQLGDDLPSPATRRVALAAPATALVVGHDVACAHHAGGALSCWGTGSGGALEGRRAPAEVKELAGTAALAFGSCHHCALAQDGAVTCWNGCGEDFGRVAIGPAVAVSSAIDGDCALLRDGTVSCWGNNYAGELGRPYDEAAYRALPPALIAW
jgi:alpha-tubulin suppressor-like RCC1 family protein